VAVGKRLVTPGLRLTLFVILTASACTGSEADLDGGADNPDPRAGIVLSGARVLAPTAANRSSLYLTIENGRSTADTLQSIETGQAEEGSLHEMTMTDGMMGMSALEWIAVPAGSSVELSPGGLHGMLEGLSGSWDVGDSISVTLGFAKAGPLTVWATVRDPADAHANH